MDSRAEPILWASSPAAFGVTGCLIPNMPPFRYGDGGRLPLTKQGPGLAAHGAPKAKSGLGPRTSKSPCLGRSFLVFASPSTGARNLGLTPKRRFLEGCYNLDKVQHPWICFLVVICLTSPLKRNRPLLGTIVLLPVNFRNRGLQNSLWERRRLCLFCRTPKTEPEGIPGSP